MRTLNENFAAAAENEDIRNRNFNYNSNLNNSNGYGYSSSQSQNTNNNSAIPYHARENSLPFSYGQIGKTSTPLKNVGVTNGAGGASGYRSGSGYGNNINSNNNNNHNYNNDSAYLSNGGGGVGTDLNYGGNYRDVMNDNYRRMGNDSGGTSDASTIKSQPRLKSPLLVRKTLGSSSHSPTRGGNGGGTNGGTGTSNTISNTYHYNYGNYGHTNGNGFGAGRLSPTTNGNGLNSNFYGTTNTISRQRTPTRNDFEELLRERREKVFNEYRESVDTTLSQNNVVVPPPRQFRSEDTTDAAYATPSSRHRKYNYDFEFHLNLDDDDWPQTSKADKLPPQPPVRRTSTNALDQYSNIQTFGRREQLQREQYRTRDIELPPLAPRDVERSYHTMSSATYSNNSGTLPNKERERPSPQPQWAATDRDRYFETYEQRRQQTQSLPHPQRQRQFQLQQQQQQQQQQLQPQSLQQQQRAEYTTTTTYGNGNAPGYGYNSNHNNINNSSNNNFNDHNVNNVTTESTIYRSSLNAAPPTSTPIYATTTKQFVKSTAYRNEPTTPTTSITDYPVSANTASPTSAVTPTTPLYGRPETPAFPVTPRTPFGTMQNGYSPNGRRLEHSISNGGSQLFSSETIYQLTSPRSRLNSNFSVATSNADPQKVAPHLVKFAKDSSKFWYKPNLSRDEAISLLINASPGTFLVRDSTTYKNAYGLVLRVAQPPPNATTTGKPDELVRHFLIEPTTRGVRLKGCPNEPVFTSLSALVYEHSINQLALPCLLRIPEQDLVPPLIEPTPAQKQLLSQGAACNVLWLYSCDTESLTGEEAIRKAIRQLYALKTPPKTTEVHFKVSQQGITLTDNTRKMFFRKHYSTDVISFCAIDPDHRQWSIPEPKAEGDKNTVGALKKTIFAFVARRSPSSKDNQCHVFCDLAINQPASAIVSFANKTLPTEKQNNYVL